jgi:hypothetical protein
LKNRVFFSGLEGCGSHGSRSRVLGFSGLTGRGFKLLDSAGAPPSPDFSPSRRSWRIGSSRVVGHGFYGFRVLSLPGHLWFTGSPEIASPASSSLVGATHRRIGLHLPQLSRSHLSLSSSRLSHLSVSSLYFSPPSVSPTLSVLLCSCEKRKKEDEERRRRTNKKRKEEKKSGRGAVRELKEEGEVGWVAREVGGERVDRIGLLSILLFYF